MADYNETVIAEFRANEGRVQNFGSSLLLLHTVGAKSGEARINPVMSIAEPDGTWLVAASFAGAPRNPAWYFNLLAAPTATIETGTTTLEVASTEIDDPEYESAWAQFTTNAPGFANYQVKAGDRRIPVLRLTPVGR